MFLPVSSTVQIDGNSSEIFIKKQSQKFYVIRSSNMFTTDLHNNIRWNRHDREIKNDIISFRYIK